MPDEQQTEGRKVDHVRIVLHEDVAAKGIQTGFAAVRLPHRALPEIDLDAVDLRLTFLGKPIAAPLMISSMTGGAGMTGSINMALAEAAEALRLPMGVGSQRAAVVDSRLADTYQVRRVAPTIPLLANIGAVQLNYGFGVDECRRAVDMIAADALILHLNPLQEAVQPEGNVNFHRLLPRIAELCRQLEVPVVVKEVGNGIGAPDARRLADAGVAVIDVAGAGGTSWSEVERFRQSNDRGRRIAAAFADWGLSTVDCVREVRAALPNMTLIASGGIRSGVDVAKAIALGADLAATARPALIPAVSEGSTAAVIDELNGFLRELQIAMFCCGCADLRALRALSPAVS